MSAWGVRLLGPDDDEVAVAGMAGEGVGGSTAADTGEVVFIGLVGWLAIGFGSVGDGAGERGGCQVVAAAVTTVDVGADCGAWISSATGVAATAAGGDAVFGGAGVVGDAEHGGHAAAVERIIAVAATGAPHTGVVCPATAPGNDQGTGLVGYQHRGVAVKEAGETAALAAIA